MTRAQLTDDEWGFIEPYLPIGEYGPYPERLREQFEGVIWKFRSGAQWREMPERFGAWSTVVHNRFRQWRDAGVFEALLEGVIAEAAGGSDGKGHPRRARMESGHAKQPLARAAGHTPQACGAILKQLLEGGLVTRSAGRGRIVENRLTAEGTR